MTNRCDFPGVIIAGGRSRRFISDAYSAPKSSDLKDKFLQPFGPATLLGFIVRRAQAQISPLWLNVNGDQARVRSYGLEVLSDEIPDRGPLGGILAAMNRAKNRGYRHIITFSGDCPFFPDDYVARLSADSPASIILSNSEGRDHPVMARFAVSLGDDLAAYLAGGERRVMEWIRQHPYEKVVWDNKNPDPFLNINTADELAAAKKYLKTAHL